MRCDLFWWCLHRMQPSNFVVRLVRLEKLCRRHKPQPLFFLWFFLHSMDGCIRISAYYFSFMHFLSSNLHNPWLFSIAIFTFHFSIWTSWPFHCNKYLTFVQLEFVQYLPTGAFSVWIFNIQDFHKRINHFKKRNSTILFKLNSKRKKKQWNCKRKCLLFKICSQAIFLTCANKTASLKVERGASINSQTVAAWIVHALCCVRLAHRMFKSWLKHVLQIKSPTKLKFSNQRCCNSVSGI